MSTWHQQRNPIPLFHETMHTVVSDPPNDCLVLTRFEKHEEAQAYLDRLIKSGKGKHCYVLLPLKMRSNHVQ